MLLLLAGLAFNPMLSPLCAGFTPKSDNAEDLLFDLWSLPVIKLELV